MRLPLQITICLIPAQFLTGLFGMNFADENQRTGLSTLYLVVWGAHLFPLRRCLPLFLILRLCLSAIPFLEWKHGCASPLPPNMPAAHVRAMSPRRIESQCRMYSNDHGVVALSQQAEPKLGVLHR